MHSYRFFVKTEMLESNLSLITSEIELETKVLTVQYSLLFFIVSLLFLYCSFALIFYCLFNGFSSMTYLFFQFDNRAPSILSWTNWDLVNILGNWRWSQINHVRPLSSPTGRAPVLVSYFVVFVLYCVGKRARSFQYSCWLFHICMTLTL